MELFQDRKVILGICAMSKKSNSKPMSEIIQRLNDNFDRLQVHVFDEDTILNKPVEEWPIVNGLVSFFSHGFPLEKAIAYKNLRSPFIVNDLEMQYILQDRRKVYSLMEKNKIPHPRYAVLDRNDTNCHFVETEDSIEVNGKLFMKPFVEKPVDAEDHNIYIYFPVAAGGGSTRLFRKIKDRSSIYSRFCRVRSTGSYLYEDFMPTDGTDVKVYTVGPDYQHAEARKSPALDGKVERDRDGKEIRYPVLLSNGEKMIARNVCKVFKQNVCGFDLLRASGKHFVCDVNGFSFVKTSSKYYDDCAKILGTLVMRACCPQLHLPYPMCTAPEDIPVVQTTSGSMMELRCVIAVIRHGDRTPKQKMKMEVKNKKFFDLFQKYGGYKSGHLKLKKPKQLQEVLDIVRHLLGSEGEGNSTDPEVGEKRAKLNQLKLVLEMYGHFSGINRKVQLKYQPTGRPKRSSSEEGLHSWSMSTEPCSEDDAPRDPSLVLILKWGGELTPAGRVQAENLGKAFRTLYPGGQGSNGQFEAPGLGFLRLHSTFRHDLKIYASDEGRVQMTAAAFTKGLLALEGELTPIVVQMVKSANTNGLLDGEVNTSKYQMVIKEKLKGYFNQDRDFTEEDYQKLAATNSISLVNAMQFVKNPFQMCTRVHDMIQEITARIRCLKIELKSRDLALFNGESWELLIRRWAKLEKDFRLKNDRFDISKIPDIYDCIKYDLQHNQKTLQFKRAHELFMCSKALADIIIPQEYGITKEDRLHIGQNYCTPLLMKIRSDLVQCINEPSTEESTTRLDSKYSKGVASPERFVRTRLYFTSESHIHSLLTMLRYGGLLDEESDGQWKQSMDFIGACAELNYMSQIVLMMFEDPAKDIESDERFHIELHFSPGAYTSCDEIGSEPKGMGFRPKQNRDTLSGNSTPSVLAEGLEESENPFTSVIPAAPDSPLMMDAEATAMTVTYPNSVTRTSEARQSPPPLRYCASEPGRVQDIGELQEADLFSHGLDLTRMREGYKESRSDTGLYSTKQKKKIGPGQPHSPDPNAPEWDWGEDDIAIKEDAHDEEENWSSQITKPTNTRETQKCQDERFETDEVTSMSLPKHMEESQYMGLDEKQQEEPGYLSDLISSGKAWSMKERSTLSAVKGVENEARDSLSRMSIKNKTKPIEIITELPKSGGEEKRSRSLEDSVDTGTITDMEGMVSKVPNKAYQRNYRTIHLPLGSDLVMKPLPAFFFYNQAPRALEGFNNVPLLHPLETLHNNLTFHQVDDFLGKVCATRFPVPDMHALASLASKNNMELAVNTIKVSEFPSSSNSSGGPNSPTTVSTPADLLKTLGMYIGIAKSGADSEAPVKDPIVLQETKENMELDLSNLAMIGSYTITMDSNTSSSMEGQIQVELLDQTHGQSKNEILEQVEGHGEGEGQGKPQSQISDQGSGQFQLGAQDSLEECMAQL
ncbi:hypothetical protein RRG08_017499 [Elysia crispata]|uniref:Inositol hexakisphosphate and diphosphoinositol-pentakisphosphate kinase n=1 Tax=Elysia crispata TaxID=231223 RepID=A0AAE1DY10_9GAST|nr:hypothetical protein RRG08_017499 [Elysia crispata]